MVYFNGFVEKLSTVMFVYVSTYGFIDIYLVQKNILHFKILFLFHKDVIFIFNFNFYLLYSLYPSNLKSMM